MIDQIMIDHRRFPMTSNGSLATRLKKETASLHLSVEEQLDLPDSVRTKAEYADLLRRLLIFHGAFEAALAFPKWSGEWSRIGITLGDHTRSPELIHDFAYFNQATGLREVPEEVSLSFTTFAQALGGLYVIEGSSLGGKILAPLFRAHLGEIPTRYYESYGRNHPQPWRSVQSALARFEQEYEDADEVIIGAAVTFRTFGRHLAVSRRQTSEPLNNLV